MLPYERAVRPRISSRKCKAMIAARVTAAGFPGQDLDAHA